MGTSWSSDAGIDLHLDVVEFAAGRAEGLAAAIRRAVAGGRLATGSALPSTRALAADLGLARGTVTEAYRRLAEQGYLTVTQGAPTRVAAGLAAPARLGPRPEAPAARDPAAVFGWGAQAPWDLRPGRPCTALFPRTDWVAATRAVLARVDPTAFDYPDPRGALVLREALAVYLGRARGVVADPERIVVSSGFGQGLGSLAAALHADGVREVAFEDPSLWLFRDVVSARGPKVVAVPVDAGGLRVGDLHSPVVVLTPAHQNPLGMTLHPARRAELAAARDVLVVEDDYDGEFRFDATPVGALQALAPDHVVYGGTASKALAPAVGLGWLVLPARLVEPVAEAARSARAAGGGLAQLVLAELLTSGRYDRHVRRARGVYRRRRAALLAALGRLPVTVEGTDAGLHVVLGLPAGSPPEGEVLAVLAARGVAVASLSAHWFGPGPSRPGLVVGYAAPAEHAFAGAVEALVRGLAQALGARRRPPRRPPA